jgi:glycosyltransferase involved in cell wall biosynthesis
MRSVPLPVGKTPRSSLMMVSPPTLSFGSGGWEVKRFRMRICVDFTSAIGDRTGIGTYTTELVRALAPLVGHPPIRLAVHAFRHPGWHRKVLRRMEGVRGRYEIAVNRLVPHGLLLESEHRLGLPPVEALFGASDVHHGTNFLAPPGRRSKTVVTVHDLAFVRFASEIPVPHRYRRYIGSSLRRADRIIAVSEATRRDVLDLFEVAEERVVVVPEGAPVAFPALPRAEFDEVRRGLGLPERFLLFVGTLEPRKNLPRLVRAFGRAARRIDGPIGLLLAGRRGWALDELREALRETHAPIAAPGFLETAVKNAALRAATALVLPSLWEGFGLPVLEAFRAGAPVLASSAGALPEVAGNAALFVTPESEKEIEEGIVRLAGDQNLRARLAARGHDRVARFTWERAARETLEVYRNV